MLLTQHLCHLLLQGIDALLSLEHLALRFLTKLFGAFAELHALQLSDQRLQPADFAGVRRHPLRQEAVILRHLADGVLLRVQQGPETGIFVGEIARHALILLQLRCAGQGVPSAAGASS